LEAAAPQVRRACLEGTADQKREKKRGKEDMTRQNVWWKLTPIALSRRYCAESFFWLQMCSVTILLILLFTPDDNVIWIAPISCPIYRIYRLYVVQCRGTEAIPAGMWLDCSKNKAVS